MEQYKEWRINHTPFLCSIKFLLVLNEIEHNHFIDIKYFSNLFYIPRLVFQQLNHH